MSALNFFLQLECTCEESCESVWPPNASLYTTSTCVHLRLLAGPFVQGFKQNITAVPRSKFEEIGLQGYR